MLFRSVLRVLAPDLFRVEKDVFEPHAHDLVATTTVELASASICCLINLEALDYCGILESCVRHFFMNTLTQRREYVQQNGRTMLGFIFFTL